MNRLIYILLSGTMAFLLTGCDQDIDYPYEGKDRIQFRHYTTNTQTQVRSYTDSLVFSFGLIADSIEIDTAKIVMEYLGKGSDDERTYYVSVGKDSTTAQEGVHYEVIGHEQKFRPLKLTDTLRIVIYRKNLSTSFKHPENMRLDLRLEASEDFDLGLKTGLKKKILINNYLSEPIWWEGNFWGALGFYHPKKWKILISFNDKFANQTSCPFNQNNEGKGYRNGLDSYLRNVAVYDDETGDRIYLNELVPQEK